MSGLQAISNACYVLVHEVDRDQFPSDIHIASSNPSTVPHNLYLINALPTAKQHTYIYKSCVTVCSHVLSVRLYLIQFNFMEESINSYSAKMLTFRKDIPQDKKAYWNMHLL